jgi:hypothetical protein
VGQKILEYFLRILQNVIEKSFINWRVLSLVKINTRISETLYILTRSAYNEFFLTFVVFLCDNLTRKFVTNQIAAFLKFGPIKFIYIVRKWVQNFHNCTYR